MRIDHTHCCYCRRKFGREKLAKTKEHFIPVSREGLGGENILQCCKECNEWKADKMPDVWLNRVQYYSDKRSLFGTYTLQDYRQIIGSVRHWTRQMKGKKISAYKY